MPYGSDGGVGRDACSSFIAAVGVVRGPGAAFTREGVSPNARCSVHPVRGMRRPSGQAYGCEMGLLRGRGDEPVGERFVMREKLLAIGDDYWIENDRGERAFKVNDQGESASRDVRFGEQLGRRGGADPGAQAQHPRQDRCRALRRHGRDRPRALVGIRARFAIGVEHGADMKATGTSWTTSTRSSGTATRSRRSPRNGFACGTPTVSTSPPGDDAALILATTVAIDSLTTRD